MENLVSLGGKEGCTNIPISTKPRIEPGTSVWLEAKVLPTTPNMPTEIKELTTKVLTFVCLSLDVVATSTTLGRKGSVKQHKV